LAIRAPNSVAEHLSGTFLAILYLPCRLLNYFY